MVTTEGHETAVDVSVIVPAYRAQATLAAAVESLLAQRFSGRYEVVVVASGDRPSELPALPDHPLLRVERRLSRLRAAQARNLGAALAAGAALAFTDADIIAPEDWLERLLATGQARWCVAGAVANGTPRSTPGTVQYLVEFFDLSPARPTDPQHGATCNLLLPRSVWEAYGPFPEGIGGCEDTWLTTRLFQEGLLRFAPDAYVLHVNQQRLPAVLAHQYELGGFHARLAAQENQPLDHPARRSAIRTAGRIRYLYRSLRLWTPDQFRRAVKLSPLVVGGFVAWGLGLMVESRRVRRRSSAP